MNLMYGSSQKAATTGVIPKKSAFYLYFFFVISHDLSLEKAKESLKEISLIH
jgi:hypothetical protein